MAAVTISRRTPLGHDYASASVDRPEFWSAPGLSHAHDLAGTAAEPTVRLFDLTTCDRFGLKGAGSRAWLAGQGLAIPAAINTWCATPGHDLDVLRLGGEDLVVLSRPGTPSGSPSALRTLWKAEGGMRKGYDAWRDESWAWFHLCGSGLTTLMAMTCPVDLQPHGFGLHAIVQTRVAQMDCIVVRSDRTGLPGFDLFFDVASSAFMLASLKELGSA